MFSCLQLSSQHLIPVGEADRVKKINHPPNRPLASDFLDLPKGTGLQDLSTPTSVS
jgi:hypothetical protein